MSDKAIDLPDEVSRRESYFDIPSVGVGTNRTSAAWIAVMLMAESPDMRAGVLASVMEVVGVTPEQCADEFYDKACNKCGISILAHKRNNGECF